MKQPQEKRKPRSDKGLILITDRDLKCLGWIADQYAVRLDQMSQLLTRWHGYGMQGNELSPTTIKDQIQRWRRAGWIEYQRVLANSPGWAWVTKKGLQTLGWEDFYTYRLPAPTRLNHIYAVNQVRLFLDSRVTWKSEREYRGELLPAKKGETQGPIPDAVITTEKYDAVAVEVELTAKKPDDMKRKLETLVRFGDWKQGYRVFDPVFSSIWFSVPDERMKKVVVNARGRLREDEQRRVKVAIYDELLP